MPCAVASLPPAIPLSIAPRKRTMSFSTPMPNKSARTPLRRTGSFLSLADMQAAEQMPPYGLHGASTTFTPTNSLCIGQYDSRMRRRRSRSSPKPLPTPQNTYTTSRRTAPRPRMSSPLAPMRVSLSERPSLPRTTKQEPDLHRTAIETCMRQSPIGRNILTMGPRIAISIISATEALEIMVAETEAPEDIVADADVFENIDAEPIDYDSLGMTLSASWVDVSQEEWELVDCAS